MSEQETVNILIADDLEENLLLLEAMLAPLKHNIITASNGLEAVELTNIHHPDLLLLDVMMPKMTGIEACRLIREKEHFRFTPIVMVTSLSDVKDKIEAIEAGATDFLTKPLNKLELITRVTSLLRVKSLQDELVSSYEVIVSLALAIEAKDPYTKGHSERVANIAKDFSKFLDLSEKESELIYKAGLLHDIGKIGVSDTLLQKEGKLTKDEYLEVIEHPSMGEQICRFLRPLKGILPNIKYHHERHDGNGPNKLSGKDIPLGARIIAIVDTYDAITSTRSYRKERTPDEAVELFSKEKNSGQWDPDLVEKFFDFIDHLPDKVIVHKGKVESIADSLQHHYIK